jgi:hypothetical protein
MAEWEYQVIALPRDVMVMKKTFGGGNPAETIAGYVQSVIMERAREGWEFYRIDTVNVVEKPGCLGGLLGQKETAMAYNLLTFRKSRSATSG